MIQFPCPCGKALQVQEDAAGQTTYCPECGRELAVPGGAGVQVDAPRTDARPPDEAVRPSRPDRPHGLEGEHPTPPPTTSGKAVASVILGVLSLFLCSVFTGVPAIILGRSACATSAAAGAASRARVSRSPASSPAPSAASFCR